MELDYINIVGNIVFAIAFWVGLGVFFGGIRQLVWESVFPKISYLKLALMGGFVPIEVLIIQPWLHNKSDKV